MTYICIVINVVIYIHYSMVTALGSIVIQELIFRNKILLYYYYMGPYMGEKISNAISSESTLQIHSQKSCILLRRDPTKVVQRIVKFQILDFCQFFLVFVNMGPYGSKSFKQHLVSNNTPDFLPKIHVLLGSVSSKVVQRIVKFEIFGNSFCSFLAV